MNIALVTEILSWILPPLLGAIIGYITNDLAIKMLFRPLTEKRIFKIRIPLTPGIIPRQRKQLADSIGNMVHKNLITVEALTMHLESEKIRTGIERYIENLTDSVINKSVSELDKEQVQFFFTFLEKFLIQTLDKLFSSENFQDLLQKGIKGIIDSLGNTKISALFEKTNLKEILVSYVFPFLTGDKMQSLLSKGINNWMKNRLEENTPLSHIIPDGLIDMLAHIFKSFLPDLLLSLFKWLRSTEIRYLLETQGRGLLKDILDKLNIMQKFFISVGQYDKTLENKMPEIVEDALNAFETGANDPTNQATFIEAVKEAIIKWEEHGIVSLFNEETDDVSEKINLILERVFNAISNDSVRSYIANGVDDFLTSNKEKTIKDILEGEFNADILHWEELAFTYVINYLTREKAVAEISGAVIKFITNLLNNIEHVSLGKLFNIDAAQKAKIDQFIYERLYDFAREKLPDALIQINVKELVVNKINSLNIEDVEKLLLMVIEKHLKWINVFGALLGALIGFSQMLLKLFFY